MEVVKITQQGNRLDADQFGLNLGERRELRRWSTRWRYGPVEQAKILEPDLARDQDHDLGPDLGR